MNTKNSFSILAFIRKGRKNRKGEVPIYIRLSINGTTSEFTIGRSIDEEQWNSTTGKVKGNNPKSKMLNNYLEVVKAKILKHHQEMLNQGLIITAKTLKRRYLGQDASTKSLISIFKEHNENIARLVNKDYAPATIQRYETTLKLLKIFIKKKYNANDIYLNQLKYSFIEEFEFFLKTERNCAHNTAVKYNKNFKKIINLAVRNEWLDRDPFAKYAVKLEPVKIQFLTKEELERLESKETSIQRLDLIRDLFVFCCYTGLAFSDLNALTMVNFQTDEDGTKWIRTKRIKTDNTSNIPLLAKPLEIISKYKDHPLVESTNRLLPKISNQKMNSYLKELADICEISKPLHSHIGRHTFATTVTLANGVTIEAVSKMLGHSSIQMTQKYAKVLDEFVKNEMKKINYPNKNNKDEKTN